MNRAEINWPLAFPPLGKVVMDNTVRRVVDEWVSVNIFRPPELEWVYVFVNTRDSRGGQNLACWTKRSGKPVWLLRNTRGFAPCPVSHWRPLPPDPR